MSRVSRIVAVPVLAAILALGLAVPAAGAGGGPDDPPDWCFRTNANGDLPTCSYDGTGWHRSYPSSTSGPGGAGIAMLVGLVVLLGGAFTVWKVSTARRMARESGMDEDDATAMTLLSDGGFEATYLAANLRGRTGPAPASTPPAGPPSVAVRLRELRELLDEGLITQAEHDERRHAVLEDT